MAFGDRDDDLWGALKPQFKPRVVADSNAAYARRHFGGGVASRGSSDARSTLARLVKRTPEVLVKVTGRKKGAGHLAAHLDYIGRHGEVALETRDGEQITESDDVEQVAQEWSDRRNWRKQTTVSAVAMVFSMPPGTDPAKLKASVRETAEALIGENHDFVMALHTDTPRPHVHLTVRADGMDRSRFDPRQEQLFQFRERFAEALRSRGIAAEATPRFARGQARAGTSIALRKLRERLLRGTTPQVSRSDLRQAREMMAVALGKTKMPEFVEKGHARWHEVQRRYETAAGELECTGDRALARAIRHYVKNRPDFIMLPERSLREAQSWVRRDRSPQHDAPTRSKGESVPRGTPPQRSRAP